MQRHIAFLITCTTLLLSCTSEKQVSADRLDPELRQMAYDTYGLVMGKCIKEGTATRRKALAPEKRAFRALEKEIKGTLAAVDFALSRQTHDEKHPDGIGYGCGWSVRPITLSDFAEAKKDTQQAIAQLKAFTKAQRQPAQIPNWLNAKNAVEFREIITSLLWSTGNYGCTNYSYGYLPFTFEQQQLLDIEAELVKTPYGQHFAVARADYEYEAQSVVFECTYPLTGKALKTAIAEGRSDISKKLERIKIIASIR